jgi:hypothetical protein
VNGRAHTATVRALDAEGKIRFEDRANLSELREREKVIDRMSERLQLNDRAKALQNLEQKWYEARDEQQRREEAEKEEEVREPGDAREPDPTYPYTVQFGRICLRRSTLGGQEFVEPLCNFTARIVSETARDNGSGEVRHFLTVAGTLDDGTPLPEAPVSSAEFGPMNWLLRAWGSRAIPNAGQGAKDHLRCAIQKLSGKGVRRHTVYEHSGWRQLGGQWVYLIAGGAIGPNGPVEGIETALPDSLAHAILPAPPTGPELKDCVRASLAVLDLGPGRVTAPVLGAAYRAPLGAADFSLYLLGASGLFKTELAALCQQHWGAGFDARNLPGNWSSTANATETLAFTAKDMALVVDDFAPGGAQADVARMHREADRLFRGVGNHAGRHRLRPDGTPRPHCPPRSLVVATVVATGEDMPRGHSLRGRLGTVEVSKGDINPEILTCCQRDAAEGKYARAMSAYIRWLAGKYEGTRSSLREGVRLLRERYLAEGQGDEGQHARTPGIRANLAIGWDYFLAFAADVGAITPEEAEGYMERAEDGLRAMARAQAAHLQAAEPVPLFQRLLCSALASGRAHVASTTGGRPDETPDAWGWRQEPTNSGLEWKPQGRRVGWVEGEDLFLDPDAAHAEVQRLAGDQGESFPIASKTLSKRLDEKKKLKTTERGRGKLTVRKVLEHRRMDVWHLSALEVLGHEKIGPIGPEGR